MKTMGTITVQGDQQMMWEVFTDDTKSQTFGFMCTKEGAERVERMLLMLDGERELKRPAAPRKFTDSTPMPFGKYKGLHLADVDAAYLHWLWNSANDPLSGKKPGSDPLADYIRDNIGALSKEYPDGIWE